MPIKQQFELMAQYNQWMNVSIYRSAATLSSAELSKHRGAFFRSIWGTLNHIMVADIIWLKRFALHPAGFQALEYMQDVPAPIALAEILYAELGSLQSARTAMDEVIISFTREATEKDYAHVLCYQSTKEQSFAKPFGYLVQHFFNHQTHHRGQLSTLFNQLQIDIGTTDLLALIPDGQAV